MLSSMMHCVGRGIATGVAIACCTPTAGAGTPGTDRPANKDSVSCRVLQRVLYLDVRQKGTLHLVPQQHTGANI